MPHFEYKRVVASMAAFKQHASFGFWQQKLMDDSAGLFPAAGGRQVALLELPGLLNE